MSKVKSDFGWRVNIKGGTSPDLVLIVDFDKGGRSVTNDLENVIALISDSLRKKPDDYLWFYRDSERQWGKVDPFSYAVTAADNQRLEGEVFMRTLHRNKE